MRSFYLIISFLICTIKGVYSQEDSLAISSEKNEAAVHQGDSVFLITAIPDSLRWRYREPFPGCIVPMKIDTFNFGQFINLHPSQIYCVLFSRYNKAGALQDIKKHEMQILFSGGFGGMPDFSSAEDQLFQKRYGVTFHSQGCLHSGEGENETEYNQTIFAYLDKTYGAKWRSELRNDAIGFEAPEKTPEIRELTGLASLLVPENNTTTGKTPSGDSDPESSILWYIMPTSGFALLLALYFIQKRRK
ncbi:hypothetical protein D3C71_930800 [compost metagenome]